MGDATSPINCRKPIVRRSAEAAAAMARRTFQVSQHNNAVAGFLLFFSTLFGPGLSPLTTTTLQAIRVVTGSDTFRDSLRLVWPSSCGRPESVAQDGIRRVGQLTQRIRAKDGVRC